MSTCQNCVNVILKGRNSFGEEVVGCKLSSSSCDDYTALKLEGFIRDDCRLGLNKYQELREAVQALIDVMNTPWFVSNGWAKLGADSEAERKAWDRIHRAMKGE